ALNIHESGSVYFKLVSSNGLEKVVVGKTLDVSDQNITNVGDIALDSISADASSIAINLTDNQSSALDITQSTNSYLKFVTTDSSERIIVGKKLTPADNSGLEIAINDDLATALNIHESGSVYFKLVSSNGLEKVVVGKTLDVSDNNITNVGDIALDSITADGTSIAINLTDNQASALDITEGANSYLKFVTTDSSEKVIVSKTLQVNDGSNNPVFSVNNSNGNTVIAGNLTINGTTTTVNSTTVTIDDPIFTLGGDGVALTNDSKDRGIEFKWNDGTSAITPDTMINSSTYYIVTLGNTDFTQIGAASNTVGLSFVYNGSLSQAGTTGTAVISTALKTGFFGYDNSSSAFTFIQDATNSSEVFSGDVGNVVFGSGTFKGTVSLQTFGGLERAVYNPVTGLTLKNSNDFSITSDANGNTSVFSVIGATGNTTIKGTLDLNEGNITNVGSIALDSISADATSIAINLTDNQASALDITESTNSYLKFVTTNASEKVVVGKTLDVSDNNITNVGDIALDSISADASSIAINLTDNQASALDITQSTNSYLKFVTTDSSEKVIVGKDLEVSANSSILIKKATTATDPLIVLNSDTTLVANAQTAVVASVERGSNATSDAQIIWDEDYLAWKLQNHLSEQKIIQTKSPVDATITTSNTALSANTPDELEKVYLVANSNTAIDITLFEIGNLTDYTGYKVIIKKIDSGTGAITVKPYTGNTVDGANSSTGVTISTGYGSLTLIAYGSAWYVL
ncbi:hypothetical protein EB001_14565, partial [bacterium]|nr:hypothetical protein [bacterium]